MSEEKREIQILDAMGSPVTVLQVYLGIGSHPVTGEPVPMVYAQIEYQEGSHDDPNVEPARFDVPASTLKSSDNRIKTLMDHLARIYQECAESQP